MHANKGHTYAYSRGLLRSAMMEQKIFVKKSINEVIREIEKSGEKKYKWLVVSGRTCSELDISKELKDSDILQSWFHDFVPNPSYDSVVNGIQTFRDEGCTGIVAIGGGSAIDVAKCIKLYAGSDISEYLLEQEPESNSIPFLAIPSTAGTGSEATRFAVIYHEGIKQSVTHNSMIPGYVLFEPELLKPLPVYHKKAAMLDALCHATESMWSVNSTDESRTYAYDAIRLILPNIDCYLGNEDNALANMLKAANIAGRAINITQTTAGHAMCYKLTTMYGIAHGHAAALCVRKLWPYMIDHISKVSDPRGKEHLREVFERLSKAYGFGDISEGPKAFGDLLDSLGMEIPRIREYGDIYDLTKSVNTIRLKNNPVILEEEDLEELYKEILL